MAVAAYLDMYTA